MDFPFQSIGLSEMLRNSASEIKDFLSLLDRNLIST